MSINHSPAVPEKQRDYGTREEAIIKISTWLNSQEAEKLVALLGKDFVLDVAKGIIKSVDNGANQ